jgi:putative membrane protein
MFKRFFSAFVATTFTWLLLASGASAQSGSGQGGGSGSARTDMQASASGGQAMSLDRLFIIQATLGNMFEMRLAQTAQQKAESDEVKQLAQRIMQDHQKVNDQLAQLAKKQGVDVPTDIPQVHQMEIQAISSLSGREFDQEYVSCMKAAHAKDVSKYEDKSRLSKNEDVRQYASAQLPALREHRRMVMTIARTLIGPSIGDEAQPAAGRMGADNGASGEGKTSGHTGAAPSGGRSDSMNTSDQSTSIDRSGTGRSGPDTGSAGTSSGGTSGTESGG